MHQSLKITRYFNNPVEVVFAAWTQAEQLKCWHAPANVRVGITEVNLTVGGSYRIEMLHGDEGECDKSIVSGEYLEIELNKRLVYTWGWDGPDRYSTLVTVEFIAKNNGTEIQLLHENFSSEQARDKHQSGWNGCIDNLEQYLK